MLAKADNEGSLVFWVSGPIPMCVCIGVYVCLYVFVCIYVYVRWYAVFPNNQFCDTNKLSEN